MLTILDPPSCVVGDPAADVEIAEDITVANSSLDICVAEGNFAASDVPLSADNDESIPVGASAVLLGEIGDGCGKERGGGIDRETSSEVGNGFEITVSGENSGEIDTWLPRVTAGPKLESVMSERTSVGVSTSPLVLMADPKLAFVMSERKFVETDEPLRGEVNAGLVIVDMSDPEADPFAPAGFVESSEMFCKVSDSGGMLVALFNRPDSSLSSDD